MPYNWEFLSWVLKLTDVYYLINFMPISKRASWRRPEDKTKPLVKIVALY
jgi:hypothetical protein